MSGAPGEPAGDEERLITGGNPETLELRDGRRDRRLAGVAIRAGHRQRRRLDDDRRASAARHERLERLAGEWKAQRVAHRRADVGHRVRRRRRTQDQRVVVRRDDDEARP
ncbi:MAG: hypothetical protein AUG91_09280 [Actinobacteria bacterium 13_1_20CM_4_69_9]|nr:MAG: hypothetical protein AUG91_09280 [Actinobacteria bacterium 13_1_20CM_4_69_9]